MNWLAPLPVALPLLVAAGLVAAAPICYRRIADFIGLLTALCVAVACCFLVKFSAHGTLVYWFGDWAPRGSAAIGIGFVIDPIGAGMAALCSVLVSAALIFAWRYFDAVRTYFHALMLIFLAAMTGFCLTGDLFNLFVFFELMSVSAYALTAYKVEEVSALEGGINFAVTNSVGAFLLLIGIALLYGRTGALNMAQVGEALAQKPGDGLTLVALTLIFAGFFTKGAVAPFHFWLPDAHAVAPTPVCILFSGVMIELGLYGAFRVYWTVFHHALEACEPQIKMTLIIFGAATAVIGAVMCFAQRHLKRLLAFSSVSHVGLMLVGAGTLEAKGAAGAALYIIAHAFVKGGLFMFAGIFLHRFASMDELELRGRGRRWPLLGAAFAIGGFGLAGCPPFGIFVGKELIEEAAKSVGQDWLPWVFVITSALTGGAVLRAAGGIFLGWGKPQENAKSPSDKNEEQETGGGKRRIPLVMWGTAIVFVLLPACSGLFGVSWMNSAQAACERFINQSNYASIVLGGAAAEPIATVESVKTTGEGIAFGLGAAGGAVIFALFALFGDDVPKWFWRIWKPVVAPTISFLRKLQSGHVGDYVLWLVIGTVLLGAGITLPWLIGR
jgi:multicomponent Na+:H+ antiporter subunit D